MCNVGLFPFKNLFHGTLPYCLCHCGQVSPQDEFDSNFGPSQLDGFRRKFIAVANPKLGANPPKTPKRDLTLLVPYRLLYVFQSIIAAYDPFTGAMRASDGGLHGRGGACIARTHAMPMWSSPFIPFRKAVISGFWGIRNRNVLLQG